MVLVYSEITLEVAVILNMIERLHCDDVMYHADRMTTAVPPNHV